MQVNTPENKPEGTIEQQKVEVTTPQQKVEEPLSQKPLEVKQDETTSEDPNWKAFRDARKKDREERLAAELRAKEKEAEAAALRAAMEAAFKTQPVQTSSNQYGDQYAPEETEDERIEKKVQAALDAREAQLKIKEAERERQEYPIRLNQTYPDFNNIISQENIDYLDYHFPEVSRPLQRLQDGYDKWSDIYHALKKFIPYSKEAKKDSARADMNSMKPKSISSASITQPGEGRGVPNMHDLEAKRAARFAEMQRIMKSG